MLGVIGTRNGDSGICSSLNLIDTKYSPVDGEKKVYYDKVTLYLWGNSHFFLHIFDTEFKHWITNYYTVVLDNHLNKTTTLIKQNFTFVERIDLTKLNNSYGKYSNET